eukprot:2363138-Alexandrium_andersonii.AAC.1
MACAATPTRRQSARPRRAVPLSCCSRDARGARRADAATLLACAGELGARREACRAAAQEASAGAAETVFRGARDGEP